MIGIYIDFITIVLDMKKAYYFYFILNNLL